MDIIAINGLIYMGLAAVTVAMVIFFGFKKFLKIKRKKVSILLCKRIGGVNLTKKEQEYLAKNKNIRKTSKSPVLYIKVSLQNVKTNFKNKLNKLNPRWYQAEIKRLEKRIEQQDAAERSLRQTERDLRQQIKLAFSKPKEEKKKETLKPKPQTDTGLPRFNINTGGSFI